MSVETEGTVQATPEQITEAKSIGWRPKEEFRGDAEKWVDAATYLARGKEVMPILRATNKKLEDQIGSMSGQLVETQKLLTAATESIEALKEFNTQASRKEAKETRAQLVMKLKDARSENDVDAELEISDQIDELNEAIKDADADKGKNGKGSETTETTEDKGPPPATKAEFDAWVQDGNTWFGKDIRRTSLAVATAQWMRADQQYAGLTGRKFLDAVNAEVNKLLKPSGDPSEDEDTSDKVEGHRGNGGRPSGNKSYSDLTAEAKAACAKFEGKLVGPGRAYKTQKEWRDAYVIKYFSEE